ncbi:MAG: hypothetical protein M3115_00845, partial [Thermoproteota archaeon]|nr:hypothetical protein [Thermoproteota archaeon]
PNVSNDIAAKTKMVKDKFSCITAITSAYESLSNKASIHHRCSLLILIRHPLKNKFKPLP